MARGAREVAKVRMLPRLVGIVEKSGHLSSQCPKKKVHAVEDLTTATTMVGTIGSYVDLGIVSEGIPGPRGAGEEICSVGVPCVREGEFVDIEVNSGAEVSCPLASIGADTYPLHETRLSICGGHHVAAGGDKLHEFGARILRLEAGDVRSVVVTLLVRFRVMDICKALLSTQDLSRSGWEAVFLADFGDAYLVRKASGTRITLLKKRCACILECSSSLTASCHTLKVKNFWR